MPAAGREREGRPRRGAEQAPLRVELVEQREQVVLVGGAAVEEDERAFWVAVGGAESLG